MPMINPFNSNAFNMMALTSAINILPNLYGLTDQLGILPPKPTRLRTVAFEEYMGILQLLPTMPTGSPGSVGKRGKRTVRTFSIPHIPHDDVVRPEEVQGLRAFGTEDEMAAVSDIMALHLQTMRNKHAITLENLRMGALKGIILDADGSVIYNLYDEFDISQFSVRFRFSDPTFDVLEACLSIRRHIEFSLMGEVMSSVLVLVSPEFYSAFIKHHSVLEAWKFYQNGVNLSADNRKGFSFGGLTWQEYIGQASDGEGSTVRFIAEGEGHAFPLGTASTFCTYFAPADFNEAVNTLGLPLYAKVLPSKFDRGLELHTQSNPLPMCHRPALLVHLTME